MVADGKVSQEERLLQGHHRQGTNASLRVYSRDDVHGQLAFQRKVIEYVRRGGRFATPQHRGSQHPLADPAVQVEFFRKESQIKDWHCFNFQPAGSATVDLSVGKDTEEVLSSDSSSSSSSDSDSSIERETARPTSSRRPARVPEVTDEVVLAYMTSVQHAMLPSSSDWSTLRCCLRGPLGPGPLSIHP